jgi:hypothetical protein
LPENQELGIFLTIEITPCVVLSVIDMHIFEYFVSIDDVLRFEVFLDIHRTLVA